MAQPVFLLGSCCEGEWPWEVLPPPVLSPLSRLSAFEWSKSSTADAVEEREWCVCVSERWVGGSFDWLHGMFALGGSCQGGVYLLIGVSGYFHPC
jgi:hypothetical protein